MYESPSDSFQEKVFFIKRWMRNPRQFGAILPSSRNLCDSMAGYVPACENGVVIELGAGTGSSTESLIKSGVDPKNLYAFELDEKCCVLLRKKFPDANIVEGDVERLSDYLPSDVIGNVRTIVSGIPFLALSPAKRRSILKSCLSVLHPEGRILLYTYSPLSPIPDKEFGLKKKRLECVFLNVPPAHIWWYERAA